MLQIPSSPYACDNLIGGRWQGSARGEVREVLSPYTNTVIGRVAMSGTEDVAAAVEAARPSAQAWKKVPLKERTQVLFKFRELLHRDLEMLGHSAAAEAGKTIAEGKAGVLKGIEVLEYALSLQNLDDGAAIEVSRGVTCEARREPLGVVAGITPFNFPAMVPMWMFPIAVTVGNAFVLKPSEKVPITSTRIGHLMIEAGFPAGVFSIVHGAREAVDGLLEHPDVAAVGFVGSTGVARSVYSKAALAGKRALCLGGAKNPLIVVPDADPDVTVPGVVDSFTGCAGQRCMAASLMVAVGNVDPLIDRIVERARSIQLGADLGNMGALIDKGALARLEAAVDRAAADGAKIRVDGRRPTPPAGFPNGNWMAPTIIDHADPSMACARDELFGPVLTIIRVKTSRRRSPSTPATPTATRSRCSPPAARSPAWSPSAPAPA